MWKYWTHGQGAADRCKGVKHEESGQNEAADVGGATERNAGAVSALETKCRGWGNSQ